MRVLLKKKKKKKKKQTKKKKKNLSSDVVASGAAGGDQQLAECGDEPIAARQRHAMRSEQTAANGANELQRRSRVDADAVRDDRRLLPAARRAKTDVASKRRCGCAIQVNRQDRLRRHVRLRVAKPRRVLPRALPRRASMRARRSTCSRVVPLQADLPTPTPPRPIADAPADSHAVRNCGDSQWCRLCALGDRRAPLCAPAAPITAAIGSTASLLPGREMDALCDTAMLGKRSDQLCNSVLSVSLGSFQIPRVRGIRPGTRSTAAPCCVSNGHSEHLQLARAHAGAQVPDARHRDAVSVALVSRRATRRRPLLLLVAGRLLSADAVGPLQRRCRRRSAPACVRASCATTRMPGGARTVVRQHRHVSHRVLRRHRHANSRGQRRSMATDRRLDAAAHRTRSGCRLSRRLAAWCCSRS
jgi:hypothetical protein